MLSKAWWYISVIPEFWEVEAAVSGVQGQLHIHNYVRGQSRLLESLAQGRKGREEEPEKTPPLLTNRLPVYKDTKPHLTSTSNKGIF